MDISALPTLNAIFNGSAAVMLACGYGMIRCRWIAAHRACMLGAFVLSTLFLACYTIYHAQTGSHPFPGRGLARPVYFSILISHVTLAAAILPLSILTLTRALRAQFARHMKIARWTLPIWLYVSVTGVLIYVMLYRMTW